MTAHVPSTDQLSTRLRDPGREDQAAGCGAHAVSGKRGGNSSIVLAGVVTALALAGAPPAQADPPVYELVPLFDLDDFSPPGLGFTPTQIRLQDFVSSTELAIIFQGFGGNRSPGFYDVVAGTFTDLPLVGDGTGDRKFTSDPDAYAAGRRAVGRVADGIGGNDPIRFSGDSFDILGEGERIMRLGSVGAFGDPSAGTGAINDAGFVAATLKTADFDFQPVVFAPNGDRIEIGPSSETSLLAHSINNQNDVLIETGRDREPFSVARNLGQDGIDALVPPEVDGFEYRKPLQLLHTGEVLVQYTALGGSFGGFVAVLGPSGFSLQSDTYDAATIRGMNELGQIFGSVFLEGASKARYWDADSGWVALRDLIDPDDPDLQDLATIGNMFPNDSGEVVVQDSDRRVYLLTDAPKFSWRHAAPGFFGTGTNWDPEGPPGASEGGPFFADTAVISVDGTFTVSGVPDNALRRTHVGNASGILVLDMEDGTFQTQVLDVTGQVALESGVMEAGFEPLGAVPSVDEVSDALQLGPGAKLTVGAGATLKVGFDVVEPDNAAADFPFARFAAAGSGARIEVVGSAKVTADGVRLSTASNGSPAPLGTTLVVDGAASEVRLLNLQAATGQGSFAQVEVTNGGKLRVARLASFADGVDTTSAAVIRGEGSELTGLAESNLGPFETVIGNGGSATLDVTEQANLRLGGRLVVGAGETARGIASFTGGATLTAPTDFAADVIVGDNGFGSLGFSDNAQLRSSALANERLSELAVGKESSGQGTLTIEGTAPIPVATTFAGTSVGLRGEGRLELLGGALFATGRLDVGVETDAQGTIVVDGPSILGIQDFNVARVGVDGHGELLFSNGAKFMVNGDPVEAPDPTLVLDEFSIGVGEGQGTVRLESGSEFRAGVGRATTAGDLTDAIVSVDGVGSELAVGQTLFVGDSAAPPTADVRGLLEISDGARVLADAVVVERGGVISGSGGTLVANTRVLAGGVISPGLSPGTLVLEGNAEFDPGSTLLIEIGGTEADMEHDVLEVLGDLTIRGDVTLEFINGFAPQKDDQFDFIVASGALDLAPEKIEIVNLASGFRRSLAASGNQVTLTALSDAVYVPEPSSLVLLALGLGCVAIFRAGLGPRGQRRS